MNPFTGFWKPFGDAIRALKGSGDGPIFVLVVTVASLVALAAGSPPYVTLLIDLLGLGAFFGWQERRHLYKRRADDAAYDALERKDAAAVRKRLRRRLEGEGKRIERAGEPVEDGDNVTGR